MIKKNVAILISGNGSNMIELLKDMRNDKHPCRLSMVIADNNNSKGIKKAKKLGYNTQIIEFKKCSSKKDFEEKLISLLKENKIEFICLAGFMRILSKEFVKIYENKILNIHPSLLPLFKGLKTHEKVLSEGFPFHGATVHVVTEEVDCGKIIAQGITFVKKNDKVEMLSKRVLKLEHKIYKKALIHYIKKKDNFLLFFDKNIKKI